MSQVCYFKFFFLFLIFFFNISLQSDTRGVLIPIFPILPVTDITGKVLVTADTDTDQNIFRYFLEITDISVCQFPIFTGTDIWGENFCRYDIIVTPLSDTIHTAKTQRTYHTNVRCIQFVYYTM
eukprot:TRINITY_DN12448_c0_g3_i1.p4 TRINITY_DN12448_c0_g3~~TRINITY_DN12448_c0_g3_i1.p4  ORF type:complete len:124 (-),score=3.41 TRINITY_DN12448_c0_g3_i1:254-625(-)